MNQEHATELLYQALETELGGVEVYTTAIECAVNEELKEEWEEYLEQTQKHVQRMREVIESLGLDPDKETPGRKIVRHIGQSLVKAMEMARKNGNPEEAELVAGECIVHAETKDHLNWELMGELVKSGGQELEVLKRAHEEIEEEEDEHLYHTMGWTRELWMKSLGLQAVIPPPEEKRDVKSMMEAARAKESRQSSRPRKARPAASKSSKRGRSASASRSSSSKKSSSRKSASSSSSRKKSSSRR